MPNDDIIEALLRYPRPASIKQVQSFLGLATYYRKFIKGFSIIASPLYAATTENKLNLTDACQNAFDTLRTILTSDKVLIISDFDKELILETDACNYGIGAVLSLQNDKTSRPVVYFSKHLNKTQMLNEMLTKTLFYT